MHEDGMHAPLQVAQRCATAPAMRSRLSRSLLRAQSKTARSRRHVWRWGAWRPSPGALAPLMPMGNIKG
jgi:hypothetical protein